MAKPTTSFSFNIGSYNSFNFSTGAYVLEFAWKYPIYKLSFHLLSIIFLIVLNCVIISSFISPANSPLPNFEQYMQPPIPLVPSLLGQLKPAFKDTLNTFLPYLFL